LSDPGYAQTEVGIFELDGRTPPELLTLHFDRTPQGTTWSDDSWFLYFTAPSEGGFPLFRLPVHAGRPALPSALRDTDPPPADTTAADSLALVQARVRFGRDELTIRRPEVSRLT